MSKSSTPSTITGGQINKAVGIFRDALQKHCKLLSEDVQKALGNPKLGSELLKVFEHYVEAEAKPQSEFLKLISGGEKLVLDPTDGIKILPEAKDIFAYIDSDFQKWGANEPGEATGETPICVYEIVKNTTFLQMFGSLSSDTQRLCLTQAQIKGFVKKHRQWLRADGYATFFLFKSHGNLFVAYVLVNSDGLLEVHVNRFGLSYVWHAAPRHRLVVPQLA